MEIHPCVLQDIGPLGPLPCSHSTSSADHFKQGIGYRWPCAILGWLVMPHYLVANTPLLKTPYLEHTIDFCALQQFLSAFCAWHKGDFCHCASLSTRIIDNGGMQGCRTRLICAIFVDARFWTEVDGDVMQWKTFEIFSCHSRSCCFYSEEAVHD